jgi:hypothetical protein
VKWEWAYEEGEFDPWRSGGLIENDTVPDAVERFLNDKERDGLQPSTLDTYGYRLRAFTEHTPPGIMVRDSKPDHVHSYVHASKKYGGAPANATKRSRYRHVRDFFSWAVDQSLADDSPVDDVTQPRKEKKTTSSHVRGIELPRHRCLQPVLGAGRPGRSSAAPGRAARTRSE